MILSAENSRAQIDPLQRVFGAGTESSRFSKRSPLQSPLDAVAELAATYKIASLNSAVPPAGTTAHGRCPWRWSTIRARRNGTIVICYEGPSAGPGMPEMLVRTPGMRSAALGKSLFLVNDGRFYAGFDASSASHIILEAQEEWPIGTIGPGERITIDAPRSTLLIAMPDPKLSTTRKLARASLRLRTANTSKVPPSEKRHQGYFRAHSL